MNWSVYNLVEQMRANAALVALWLSAGLLIFTLSQVTISAWNKRSIKITDYSPQEVEPLQNRSNRGQPKVESITAANLFGNPNPVVVAVAPQTTLNLKLQGVLSATSPLFARAIISAGNKAEKLYKVGDQIEGAGASVEEIRPNEVLLNRAGAIERLPLITNRNLKGANIVFSSTQDLSDAGSSTVASFDSGDLDTASQTQSMNEVTPKPNSPNGERRKIKRPSFSGIDRAIKKDSEI